MFICFSHVGSFESLGKASPVTKGTIMARLMSCWNTTWPQICCVVTWLNALNTYEFNAEMMKLWLDLTVTQGEAPVYCSAAHSQHISNQMCVWFKVFGHTVKHFLLLSSHPSVFDGMFHTHTESSWWILCSLLACCFIKHGGFTKQVKHKRLLKC